MLSERFKRAFRQSEQVRLDDPNMATLGCKTAERLLGAYLQAVRDSNKATRRYVRALRSGKMSLVRVHERMARNVTRRLSTAREAFQQHIKSHGC